jgi:hypothetical protein
MNMSYKPKIEILSGRSIACSGPHPQKVHADEVELMDPIVWEKAHIVPFKTPTSVYNGRTAKGRARRS